MDLQNGVDALADARDNARKTACGLVELGRLFDDMTEPSPAMRECPACARTVMALATRCGFCWTKLVLAVGE